MKMNLFSRTRKRVSCRPQLDIHRRALATRHSVAVIAAAATTAAIRTGKKGAVCHGGTGCFLLAVWRQGLGKAFSLVVGFEVWKL